MERNYKKGEDCANLVSFSKMEHLHPSFLLLDIDWQKGNLAGGSLVRFPENLGSWETWPLGTGRGKCARNPTFSECYDQVMISIDISKKNVDIVHFDQVGFRYFGSLCKM